MKVRIAFAVISQLEEPIILVDEVLAVGDKAFREKCYTRIEELLAGGRTLFFVSHNERDLRRFCTRGLYLDKGALVLDAPDRRGARPLQRRPRHVRVAHFSATRKGRAASGLRRVDRQSSHVSSRHGRPRPQDHLAGWRRTARRAAPTAARRAATGQHRPARQNTAARRGPRARRRARHRPRPVGAAARRRGSPAQHPSSRTERVTRPAHPHPRAPLPDRRHHGRRRRRRDGRDPRHRHGRDPRALGRRDRRVPRGHRAVRPVGRRGARNPGRQPRARPRARDDADARPRGKRPRAPVRRAGHRIGAPRSTPTGASS